MYDENKQNNIKIRINIVNRIDLKNIKSKKFDIELGYKGIYLKILCFYFYTILTKDFRKRSKIYCKQQKIFIIRS